MKNLDKSVQFLSKSCLGKTRYSSISLAVKIAARVKRERDTDLRSYACDICHGYHLTSKGVNLLPEPNSVDKCGCGTMKNKEDKRCFDCTAKYEIKKKNQAQKIEILEAKMEEQRIEEYRLWIENKKAQEGQ